MTVFHNHHIIPKHMGGSDDSSNIVRLSTDDHANAHLQLYEQYGRLEDKLAWMGLSKMIDKQDHLLEMSRLAGRKTVEMKVGIHDPDKIHLKQQGGRNAVGKTIAFVEKSKWMNNGIEDTRIHIDNVEKYLVNGWNLGRLFSANRGKKNLTANLFWINKDQTNRRVPKESLGDHIELGWSLGMHMKGQS